MQYASPGLRLLGRTFKPPNIVNRGEQGVVHNHGHAHTHQARSIHIPSYARSGGTAAHLVTRIPNPGVAQKLFLQSRTIVSRFIAHLTAPGLGTSLPSNASRYTPSQRGFDAFRQNLSFPVRTALSRPIHHHFLPRPPMVPRHIAEVGLGTARRFSTGRPIFQHLVDNVPVVGRAFYELDWEVKMQKERELMRLRRKQDKSAKVIKGKELAKQKQKTILKTKAPKDATTIEEEMNHYFSQAQVPDVTTYLLVPLAPTPTGRTPLPPNTSDHPDRLLPYPVLMSMHKNHDSHAIRISSLFSRLDAANVWERGVECSAFSQLAPDVRGEGVCSILKIEFVGWTMAEVRAVIGESGTGWCSLEEVKTSRHPQENTNTDHFDSDALSEISSWSSADEWRSGPSSPARVLSPPPPSFGTTMETDFTRTGISIDPAQSFVLPTLDFSSSSTSTGTARPYHEDNRATVIASPVPQAFSPTRERGFDPWSDIELGSSSSDDDDMCSVSSAESNFSSASKLSSISISTMTSLGGKSVVSDDGDVFMDTPSVHGSFGFSFV